MGPRSWQPFSSIVGPEATEEKTAEKATKPTERPM